MKDHSGPKKKPQLDEDKPQPDEPRKREQSAYKAAVDQFEALTTIPAAFRDGPIKGIQKPVTYSVGTPDPSRWVMIDPNPDYQRDVLLLRDANRVAENSGSLYVIRGDLAQRLVEDFPPQARNLRAYTIRMATYRHTNTVIVYPLMHPLYNSPKSEEAYHAKLEWIAKCETDWRMISRRDDGGGFDVISTEVPGQEPANWDALYRGLSLGEIIYKAFREFVIDDWDHAVLREVRGV